MRSAIIKSVQRHPLSGRAVHVDFFLPDLTVELQIDVPFLFTGVAPAIEETGGTLFTSLDHLKVRALPADLPHEITIDLSPLVDLDVAIHVRDLGVDSDTVHVLNDPDEMIVKVMPPRVEEEPVVVEGEEGEGEGAEGEGEGAEGADADGSGEATAEDEG
jgi:large subunit ribosomal protein L25